MEGMTKSILSLFRALLARPDKPKSPTLNWVKSDKPLGDMTPDERKQFSTDLANEIFSQNRISQPPSKKEDFKMTNHKLNTPTEWLLILILIILMAMNLTHIPIVGDNARAIKNVVNACNAKDVSQRLAYSSKASELNSYWSDFADAVSTQAALVVSNEAVKARYEPENPTYIQTTNAYNIAYFKVIQVCSNHMKKK
jgi:hypothetical protein